ncbi:MAG: hypothetical protein ABIB43_01715 [archaeon]
MAAYGIPILETLTLTDSIGVSRFTTLSETISLSDGDIYITDKTLSETTILTDSYSRVWLATPEWTETQTLTDALTWAWVLARTRTTESVSLTDSVTFSLIRTLSQTLTLTDGDGTELIIVSPNGGYIAIVSEEPTPSAAIAEAIKLLEEQGAPRSQTQFVMTYNSDLELYTVAAIVKRH